MANITLAVPSMGEGGLEAERSGHFGHCECFTLLEINDGKIGDVKVVANPPHVEGGCLRPVNLLKDAGATAIVVAGMGLRPLQGFEGVGITVYFDAEEPIVGKVAEKVAAGEAPIMSSDQACQH